MAYQITFGPIRAWNIKYTHLLKYPQEVNEPKQGRQSERQREREKRERVKGERVWGTSKYGLNVLPIRARPREQCERNSNK